MMRAYSDVYLGDVVENQGKLFDYVANTYPDKDTEDFINAYMTSKTRQSIDQAKAYVNTMDAKELWEYFKETEHYSLKQGKAMEGFIPNWIGEFYAYYQWYYNIPSAEVNQKINVDFLKKSYYGGVNGEEFASTPTHPFYVYQHGWTQAANLRAGDVLVLSNGEFVTVEWVQHEILEKSVNVYNLEVQDFHTYFIGESGVWVHNQGCKNEKTYQTYTKTNPETGEVYSGRTSGYGTPKENVSRRDKKHHMNDKGFGPAALDKSSTNKDAIRGREQQLIDSNGGAKSQRGTSGNAINGISPNNKKKNRYMKSATDEFGELI